MLDICALSIMICLTVIPHLMRNPDIWIGFPLPGLLPKCGFFAGIILCILFIQSSTCQSEIIGAAGEKPQPDDI
jgi:hypothetical protein